MIVRSASPVWRAPAASGREPRDRGGGAAISPSFFAIDDAVVATVEASVSIALHQHVETRCEASSPAWQSLLEDEHDPPRDPSTRVQTGTACRRASSEAYRNEGPRSRSLVLGTSRSDVSAKRISRRGSGGPARSPSTVRSATGRASSRARSCAARASAGSRALAPRRSAAARRSGSAPWRTSQLPTTTPVRPHPAQQCT